MGLFSKMKKKKSVEEEVRDFENVVSEEDSVTEKIEEAEKETVETEKETDEVTDTVEAGTTTVAQDGDEDERRFTLLVDQTFELNDDEGILVVGDLFGKVKQGDSIYLLFPNNRMVVSVAEELEIGPGRAVTEAENDKVAIKISDIKRKEMVPPLTVVTNIVPNPDTKEGKELENPLLFGMTLEYPVRGTEPAYNNLLIYQICHTRFVVPASITVISEEKEAPKKVHFPTLPDMNNTGRQMLPVFTDWTALSRWEGLFDEEHPEQSVIMTFPEAVEICRGQGIVINPFGPMSIVLTTENIQQIVNLDSYKKEFGGGDDKDAAPRNVKQTQKAQPQGPGMILGVPKAENPEVKAVTDAIVAYAKQDATIKRVDLLLRSDMQQNKSFVCVVDCPQDQTSRIGEGILRATAYQRKEVQNIEFFLFGSAKFVNDMVSEESVIYRK